MNLFGDSPQLSVGAFTYDKHGHLGPRIQQNLQLVYIFEGEAVIRIDGENHYLGAHEATLLLPGREEYFTFSKTQRTRHGWCESVRPQLGESVLHLYERLPFSLPLTSRMENLAAMALSLNGAGGTARQRLYHLFAEAIFLEFVSQANLDDDLPDEPLPESLQRARTHIETDYANRCDLDTLAHIAGVSGAHLIRLFKKHLAVTPIEYLWKVRVESGARLLKETGLSISEIAYRTGFQNPYHFSRLAKKHFGHSPREYRRRAWGV